MTLLKRSAVEALGTAFLLAGVAMANAMFGLPLLFASHRTRSGPGQWLAEFVVTFGLLLVIWGCLRFHSKFVSFFAECGC
jgi:glycerol uptake facilitator-like aquaporin